MGAVWISETKWRNNMSGHSVCKHLNVRLCIHVSKLGKLSHGINLNDNSDSLLSFKLVPRESLPSNMQKPTENLPFHVSKCATHTICSTY